MNKSINTLIGNSKVLKGVNRVRVMSCLKNRPQTRAQLTRGTGLDGKTITNICNELLADELIMPNGTIFKVKSRPGRPSEVLSINDKAAFAIGIDVGIEQITGAMIDLGGNILTRIHREYDSPFSKDFLLKEIETIIPELMDTVRNVTREKIKGIGLSMPGFLDRAAGIVLQAVNIQGFKSVPIVEILEKKFLLNVYLQHNCRAMTLGEMWFGNRASDTFLYVHLGYGIGMGFSDNGSLFQGNGGISGEIGHTTVQPGGRLCNCGRRGCLEAVASGKALAEMANEIGITHTEKRDAKAVFESAKAGNAKAQELLNKTGEYIGIAIANAINLFNPRTVVLNGELLNAGEMLIGPLKKAVLEHRITFFNNIIEESKLGLDAGVLGAAIMPLKGFFEFDNIQLSQ